MDRLSNEIVLQICDLLYGSHFQSLISFSSISKRYRALSRIFLFRDVTLKAYSLSDAEYARRSSMETLEGGDGFGWVQRYALQSCIETLKGAQAFCLVRGVRLKNGEERQRNMPWDVDPRMEVPKQLETLVRHANNISDIYIDFELDTIRSLLDLLSTCQLRCRLHLQKVRFFHLHEDAGSQYQSECALISSKFVHSITAQWIDFHFMGYPHPDYTLDAVLQMVSGLAPNLKILSLHAEEKLLLSRLNGARREIRKEWSGVPGLLKGDQCHGAIEELCIWDSDDEAARLSSLATRTTFSTLRKLTIGPLLSVSTLRHLDGIDMPFLHSLSIGLLGQEDTEYDALVTAVLRDLAPLRSLKILTWYSHAIFGVIMERHGSTLRDLALPGVWNADLPRPTLRELDRIRSSCTRLESLALPVRRSLGDCHEIAAYQTLGSMHCLQSLSLNLDSSNPAVAGGAAMAFPSTFDDFDSETMAYNISSILPDGRRIKKGHVRESLINSAIDKALALQIFDTIAAAKPEGGLSLEKLSLASFGGSEFRHLVHAYYIRDVFAELSCSWLITRNVRDDERGHVSIEGSTGEENRRLCRESELHYELEPIFRRLWPPQTVNGCKSCAWRRDWHSFPLAIDKFKGSGD